jgi:hypothetical protein
MRTVKLSVAGRQVVNQRALAAFSGKRQGAHVSFASANLLWKRKIYPYQFEMKERSEPMTELLPKGGFVMSRT